MTETVSKLLDLIPQVITILGTLIAVYFGWWLSQRSETKKRTLDALKEQLNALGAQELADRMESDSEFLNSLRSRLARFLGLRIELLPHLDESTIKLLDEKFAPLFDIHVGHCELRSEVTQEFAVVCIDIVRHVDELESRLVESYRQLTK